MSNTNATLDLTAGGTYTLNVHMREDGLRLDKLLLTTDDATTPSGQGTAESAITSTLPALSSHTISYSYDPSTASPPPPTAALSLPAIPTPTTPWAT